jgi:hypothetical protein
LSSAILYLAIVAIWAVVLVPRWLHPRSAQLRPVEQPEEPTAPRAEPGMPESVEPVPAEPVPSVPEGPPLAAPVDDGSPEPAEPGPDDPDWVDEGEHAAPSSPPRAGVLQARRRTLATLVVLTAGAVGLAVSRVAAFWVIIPPAVLLAGFIVLLREASRVDAERARGAARSRHTAPASVAGQEPESFREDVQPSTDRVPVTGGSVPAAIEPPLGAEVIDISGRIGDQVYDQYSDAADRAVGD